jgi:hypothetical protein
MMMNRKVSWALLVAVITLVSSAVVSAQSTASRIGLLGEFKQKSLVGSWDETFTFVGGPRDGFTGTSLTNYNADGTLVGAQAGNIMFDPDPTIASITSDGVGVWTQTEWNTFVYTSKSYFADFNGKVTGSLIVTGIYHLDLRSGGDTYRGYSYYQGFDTSNNPMFSGFVTNTGTRLKVDLKVPAFPSPTPKP